MDIDVVNFKIHLKLGLFTMTAINYKVCIPVIREFWGDINEV